MAQDKWWKPRRGTRWLPTFSPFLKGTRMWKVDAPLWPTFLRHENCWITTVPSRPIAGPNGWWWWTVRGMDHINWGLRRSVVWWELSILCVLLIVWMGGVEGSWFCSVGFIWRFDLLEYGWFRIMFLYGKVGTFRFWNCS